MTLKQDFDLCIRNKWVISPKGVEYCVVNDTLYFQCSNEKSDWPYNFNFPVQLYKDTLTPFFVHRGFKELWHDVRDDVAKLEFSHIRGYSQGGALACFAHEDTLFRKKRVCDTVTFGCPKFAFLPPKKVQNRFVSITHLHNYNDIVHMIPIGYTAMGRDIAFTMKHKKPDGMPWYVWYSGHTPTQYRLNLENL